MKKFNIFMIFLVMILAVSAVSAADSDDSSLMANASVEEVTIGDVASDVLADGEDPTEQTNTQVVGNFRELKNIIDENENGLVELDKDYAYSEDDGDFASGISINKKITLDGKGHTIDGSNAVRIFSLDNHDILLKNITFKNAKSTGQNYADYGGAIYSNGAYENHTISDSKFINNTAYNGGAVYLGGDNSNIIGCEFDKNNATASGGAVMVVGWNDIIEDSKFNNNYAKDTGGAVAWFSTKTGELRLSELNNNVAGQAGGAVSWQKAGGRIIATTFEGNEAPNEGALYWKGNEGTITGGKFSKNKATGNLGGAIFADANDDAKTFTIYTTFEENSAVNGGAVALYENAEITDSEFTKNSASNQAGALFINGDTNVTLTTSNFNENAAGYGNAISNHGNLTVSNNVFGEGQDIKSDDQINKDPSKVTIEPIDNVTYGAPVVVKYSIENRNGIVTVTIAEVDGAVIENPNYDLTDDNVTIYGLDAGNYDIYIWNNGDANYDTSADKAYFTVAKTSSSVTIEPIFNVTAGESVGIEYYIENRSSDVSVHIYLADEEIDNLRIVGENIVIINLPAGKYSITIINEEDANHNKSMGFAEFTVKYASSVTIEPIDSVTYGEPVFVKFNIGFPSSNITMGLQKDGLNVDANYTLTKDNVTIYDLAPGDYAIMICNNEDDEYGYSDDVGSFTVKYASSVTIEPIVNVTYGEPVVVNYEIENRSSTVSVHIYEADSEVEVDPIISDNNVTINDLPAGEYSITIINEGDDNYGKSMGFASFNVRKADTVLNINYIPSKFGNIYVEVGTDKKATGKVTLTIVNAETGETVNTTTGELEDGSFIFGDLDYTLDKGRYNVTASYEDDANFTAATANMTFTVDKKVPNLNAIAYVNEYGLIIVNATIDKDATGNVTFILSREDEEVNPVADVTVAIENGTANFDELNQYKNGNYLIYVTYNGDDNYYMAYRPFLEANINKTYIDPKTTQLDVRGGEINVTVDLGVNATGKVHVVYPSGYVDNITIKNGTVNFYNVFMEETGPLSVVLDYEGDDNYYGFFEYYVDFTIKKATFITAKPISVVYNNNAKWTINLKDADNNAVAGQTIKVTVNGKTYTGTTDAKGNAVVTIPAKFVPKAYTAKIVFAGTELLENDFDNVKFTVKKATPKLTAKKKTFKKSKKVKKYKVVLKDNKKKAIKKAKLTIKVKGKKYTAKTNSKGKAVFKIKNLKKKGTYKAKVTFKATKYFNKVTKKVKIKVKK